MASKKETLTCVRLTADTFVHGISVKEGDVVPNQKVHATEQDMKDLIAYKKAEAYKAPAQEAAGGKGR